jgi:hypothetical protein
MPFLAAAVAAFGLSHAQPAAPPVSAPVKIAECFYVAPPIVGFDGMPAQPDAIRIAFVNDSQRVATNVHFVVRYGNHTQTIDESGRFSPGVLIDHEFTPIADATPSKPARCSVEAVTYTDGSRWKG